MTKWFRSTEAEIEKVEPPLVVRELTGIEKMEQEAVIEATEKMSREIASLKASIQPELDKYGLECYIGPRQLVTTVTYNPYMGMSGWRVQ